MALSGLILIDSKCKSIQERIFFSSGFIPSLIPDVPFLIHSVLQAFAPSCDQSFLLVCCSGGKSGSYITKKQLKTRVVLRILLPPQQFCLYIVPILPLVGLLDNKEMNLQSVRHWRCIYLDRGNVEHVLLRSVTGEAAVAGWVL